MRKFLLLTTALLALGLVSLQPAYAKTFYKWKDENGVTHYSSQKPHDIEAESVEIRGGRQTPSDTGSSTNTPATNKNSGSSNARSNSPTASNDADPDAEPENTLDPERCAEARDNLKTLTTYARIRMLDDEGERRYLSPEEKEEQIRLVQQEIDRVCP